MAQGGHIHTVTIEVPEGIIWSVNDQKMSVHPEVFSMAVQGGSKNERVERALLSLEGLSVGDAFGELFILHCLKKGQVLTREQLPVGPWAYTDDTEMALSIVSILMRYGEVEQDALVESFVRNFNCMRDYGGAMVGAIPHVRDGVPWRIVFPSLFNGKGSFGNGAAMRVAPLGAYFADNISELVINARKSAEVTHTHAEGIAGAIAVAVAAATAYNSRAHRPTPEDFIEQILPHVPPSVTREGIERAHSLPESMSSAEVSRILGSGYRVSSQDTVPFAIWCAAHYMDNYERALWETARVGGDADTTCAMVGGIVVLSTGRDGIPQEWLMRREPLPILPV